MNPSTLGFSPKQVEVVDRVLVSPVEEITITPAKVHYVATDAITTILPYEIIGQVLILFGTIALSMISIYPDMQIQGLIVLVALVIIAGFVFYVVSKWRIHKALQEDTIPMGLYVDIALERGKRQ